MPRTALLGFGYVPLGPELRDRENRVGAHTVEEVDGLVEARKQVGEYARTDVRMLVSKWNATTQGKTEAGTA